MARSRALTGLVLLCTLMAAAYMSSQAFVPPTRGKKLEIHVPRPASAAADAPAAPPPVTVIHASSPDGARIEPDVSYNADTAVVDFRAQMAKTLIPDLGPAELLMISKGDFQELEDGKVMGDYDFKDPNKPDAHALTAWTISSSQPVDEFDLKYKFHISQHFENVNPSETIGAVKKRIIAVYNGAPNELARAQVNTADGLELFFAGKRLEDEQIVADCQIGPDSLVYAFRQYSPGELQTMMPKSVLMAAFPNEFSDGTYIQKPDTDTVFMR